MLEYINIAGSSVAIAVHGVTLIHGAHEGQEFAWDDPVEVTILNLLVVLILSRIEILEVIPSKSDGMLQTLKTMQDGALILAGAAASVSVGVKVGLILLEVLEGGMGIHFKDHDHEGAHEVCRVCQLGKISRAGVVIDSGGALEAVRLEQLLEFTTESVRHGKVQGTEILIKRHVSQILRN